MHYGWLTSAIHLYYDLHHEIRTRRDASPDSDSEKRRGLAPPKSKAGFWRKHIPDDPRMDRRRNGEARFVAHQSKGKTMNPTPNTHSEHGPTGPSPEPCAIAALSAPAPLFVSTATAAARLSTTSAQVSRWCKAGAIPAIYIHQPKRTRGHWFVDWPKLEVMGRANARRQINQTI
jgi:hypothetical protein